METLRTSDLPLRPAGSRLSFVISIISIMIACGTLSFAGDFKVLHAFSGNQGDGMNPLAIPTVSQNGIVYGTTWLGGNLNCSGGFGYGCGEVFEISPPPSGKGAWSYAAIYEFTGCSDGGFPTTPVTLDNRGRVYGITNNNTMGFGAALSLYQLTPVPSLPNHQNASWTYKDLYDFPNGVGPSTPLLIDASGALYGVGAYSSESYNAVLQFVPTQSGPWIENVVYQFTGGSDGAAPVAIVMDSSGNIYGIAISGGINNNGTVFEIQPSPGGTWTFSVLYSFTGSPDRYPHALARDSSGNLYGLAANNSSGWSEIFELSPKNGTWTESILYLFRTKQFSGYPPDTLAAAPDGTLYGTVSGDPDFYGGALFAVAPPAGQGGWTLGVVHNFNTGAFSQPNGVAIAPNGDVYGTSADANGDVYEFTPGGQ
jgi:hypothetical protein